MLIQLWDIPGRPGPLCSQHINYTHCAISCGLAKLALFNCRSTQAFLFSDSSYICISVWAAFGCRWMIIPVPVFQYCTASRAACIVLVPDSSGLVICMSEIVRAACLLDTCGVRLKGPQPDQLGQQLDHQGLWSAHHAPLAGFCRTLQDVGPVSEVQSVPPSYDNNTTYLADQLAVCCSWKDKSHWRHVCTAPKTFTFDESQVSLYLDVCWQ
jgi:hypothetical protein